MFEFFKGMFGIAANDKTEPVAITQPDPPKVDGTIPRIEIIGEGIVSTDKFGHTGVELSLDWNDAFIDYLKTNGGYAGASDNEIIQKWLRDLGSEQAKRLHGKEFL